MHEESGTINKQMLNLLDGQLLTLLYTTFLNTNVSEILSISSNTILNVLSNFIPHETVVSEDNGFKSLIKEKKKIYSKNTAKTVTTFGYYNA